jgi:hypothetical protein
VHQWLDRHTAPTGPWLGRSTLAEAKLTHEDNGTSKKKSPELTIEDAKYYCWEGYNFLDKAALTKKAAEVYSSLDSKSKKQREAVRKKICQNLNCNKWTNVNPSLEQKGRVAALLMKYGEKKLTDLQSQKELYWLLTDQRFPSRHNFRAKIIEKHEQDWKKIDLWKLYIQARVESFQWRSAHGKLYARRDLVRFNFIQKAYCIYCYEPQQTIEHLYTECGRTQILFKNFEKHYKLDTELTWCKKNYRNEHKRTTTQGDTQKAGHPEEANLQLQPQR